MDLQPKIEPGSPPQFDSNSHRSMSEGLHADVDRFDDALLPREAKHNAEIGSLQEKFELERLMRLQAEEEFKRARESYEALLKKVKENDSSNVIAELRNKVAELQNEKLESEVPNKNNLETIESLRTKLTRKKINVCVSVGGNTEKKPQAPLQRVIVDSGRQSLGASGMAPKVHGGKRQRQHAASSDVEDRELVPPNDPDRFCNAIAEDAWNSLICQRNIIFEYSFHFTDTQGRLNMVIHEIERRGWKHYLLSVPAKANITLVREFYANFYDRSAEAVFIRGKLIPVTIQHLTQSMRIVPEADRVPGDEDHYQHMLRTLADIDLEAVKNRLTLQGSSWQLNAKFQPHLLLNASLTLEARAWARILLSHILPSSHISDLTVERALFIYCVMEQQWIDLPFHIQRHMHTAHHDNRTSLPYPSFITALATSCGVEDYADDEWQTGIPSLTGAGLAVKDSAAQNKGKKKSNPLDSVSAQLAQMELNLKDYIDQCVGEAQRHIIEYLDQQFTT